MIGSSNGLRGLVSLWNGAPSAPKPRRSMKADLSVETLEGRVVLSSLSHGGLSGPAFQHFGGGGDHGGGGGDHGGGGGGDHHGGGGGHDGGGGGQGTSSILSQDARLAQQAFQTFNSSFQGAVAALRLTATSTAGPSAAGLTAFNTTIETAIATLNASIKTDLANLTNTGAALNTTIDGFTASLQAELESAATGLANSSNSAVNALNQEANGYLRTALDQTTSAIRNDAGTGAITSTTLQTYNQAVRTAEQAFNTAINAALPTTVTVGTTLSSTAVSTAVANLQTALTSALAGLGTGLTTSAFDPTATIATDLTNLTTQLDAATATSTSARAFAHAVASIVSQNLGALNQTVSTAVQNYNNSLL